MKNISKLTIASMLAGLVAFSFAGSAQASTFIDFGTVPIGGTPSYVGSSLDASTSFSFGGGLYLVSGISVGDQSGLSVGDTVALTSPVVYGSGNSGSTSLIKSWTDALGTFTETLTSFTANRSVANAITITFAGTLSGPGGLSQSAFAILAASQVGGPGTNIGWSLTNTSVSQPAFTPLPASLPLFAAGLGGLGLLGWRKKRRRNNALAASAST